MNLQKILAYQEIDEKLFKLENELRASDVAKEYFNLNKKLSGAQEELFKQDRLASDIYTAFDKANESMATTQKEIEEITTVIKSVNDKDFSEVEFYNKKIEKLLSTIDFYDREARKLNAKISDIKENVAKTLKQGQLLQEKAKTAKQTYEDMKKTISPEANTLIAELAEIEKELNPKIMQHYKKLRNDRKMPPVVKYQEGRCARCGMDIATDMRGKLKNAGDTIECPNCGRFIYVE